MAITASDSGGGREFKRVPPGAHFAICNMIVDLGIQQTNFQGKAKSQHQVFLRWEVPDERVSYEKDGKTVEGPCSIGRTYTLSLSEKANLRKDLENWRGKTFTEQELKGFDITSVAGKCCQVMVTHKTAGANTYANITGIMGISRDQRERARSAQSEVGVLVYALDAPDTHVYERLPQWIKDKLAERVSAPSVHTATDRIPGSDDEEFSDDIPF